jgi:hypothetical protein
VPASRKTRSHTDTGPAHAPAVEPVEEASKVETPAESHPRTEGKRAKIAPARRKKQHGTAYRWISAYMPILAGLFILLGALWVYTGFINPPPVTPAQQWTKIENAWSPAREKARQAIAADVSDFTKMKADYKDFYTQTRGWIDAVTPVKDWGVGAQSVSTLLSDGQQYEAVLTQAIAAKTPADLAALAALVQQADSTFNSDVAAVKTDLALPATNPLPSALVFPSVNPTPTAASEGTGSPAPSATPAASVTPAPTPTSPPSPTASPS